MIPLWFLVGTGFMVMWTFGFWCGFRLCSAIHQDIDNKLEKIDNKLERLRAK